VVVRLRSSHRLRSPSNGAGRTTTARHAEAALRFFMTSARLRTNDDEAVPEHAPRTLGLPPPEARPKCTRERDILAKACMGGGPPLGMKSWWGRSLTSTPSGAVTSAKSMTLGFTGNR